MLWRFGENREIIKISDDTSPIHFFDTLIKSWIITKVERQIYFPGFFENRLLLIIFKNLWRVTIKGNCKFSRNVELLFQGVCCVFRLHDLRWARNPTKYDTFILVLTFGRVRMLKTLWKAHKSKDWMFLLRNYIQKKFSTPKKNIFSQSKKICSHFFSCWKCWVLVRIPW